MNYKAKKWRPVTNGLLKHRIAGRQTMYLKFSGKFDIDDIRDFAQEKSNELARDGRVRQIQVGVVYSVEGDYSGSFTDVGEAVDVKDLKNHYNHDIGEIVGFNIYLN